jgi:hypothetical protein
MAASTTVNGRTVVHRQSGGTLATFPDVCLTPTSGGPVPIPYPNVARTPDLVRAARTVTVDGAPVAVEDSVFGRSTGDEPGTQKGVVSGAVGGEARFFNWSFDVKIEGKGACRLLDPMASNGGSPVNTPPAAEVQPALAVAGVAGPRLDHVHHLLLSFKHAYRDVDVPDGRPDFLALETPLRFTGPENETWSPVYTYTGATIHVWEPGDYTMRFDAFDLERRELLPPSTLEKLRREAARRLRRAQRAAENAVEDLEEVAARLERDVVRAGADLDAEARRALAEARAHLETARAQARRALDQIGRAVEQAEGGGWQGAARSGLEAAQTGRDAVGEASEALRGVAEDASSATGALRDSLRRAVDDAALGLTNAGRDVQNALVEGGT